MSIPATVRVNALFPFPALVQGSGPVTLTKANGVWTVGLSIIQLGQTSPLPASLPTTFVIIQDSITKSFFKVSLTGLGLGGAKLQRSVTATPIVVAALDQILNCNIAAPAACALPAAATRNGVPLTFKDLGQAATNNITLTANAAAGDTIDGAATFVMNTNWRSITLNPFNDGVNTGWFIT